MGWMYEKFVWFGLCAFYFPYWMWEIWRKDVLKIWSKIENNKDIIWSEMEIVNNEDIYKYDVKVSYQKKICLKLV